jgi:hypothetical protein
MSQGDLSMEKFEKIMKRREKKNAEKKELRAKDKEKYAWLTEKLLAETLDQIVEGYIWRSRKHLEGLGGNQHVDVVGSPSSQRHHVYIEIEGGRSNPVSNVAKIWRHVAEGKLNASILIVQIFSPTYRRGAPHTRMQESIFIGEQAEKASPQIIYRFIGPDSWPNDIAGLDNLIGKVRVLTGEIN